MSSRVIGKAVLTVASIPAAHPYVSSVVDAREVTLLTDPVPPGATETGQWWPPQWLEPDYLRSHLDGVDVLHVHFGFDSNPPDQLTEIVTILDERDVPLVVTVHDLRNPHFTDQSAHARRLDVLIPAATTVVTLTDGAANEITRRWARDAVVLPHPHVLPLEVIGRHRPIRPRPIVGIHAKNLRANVDPWPVLDHLIAGNDGDLRLRLDLDEGALTAPRAHEADAPRLERYRRAGVDVRVHRRFSDSELAEYLTEIDVLVLPYRHGTHSGWVEACHDAGVAAVVPDCGYFDRQHGDPVFRYGTDDFDPGSLEEAVDEAVRSAREASPSATQRRRSDRAEEQRLVRESMTLVYRDAVTSPRRHFRAETA